MGYRIEDDQRIIMTRGDTAKITVGIKYKDSEEYYQPIDGEIVRFSVKKYLSDKQPAIEKDVPINLMILQLDPEDTKPLPFGYYHYDFQLIRRNGEVVTFIEDKVLELTGEVN